METNEKVKYSYELDISSLQKGTKQAITAMQKQIDYMTGITNKTKSAEASARVFEKAWLNASSKVIAAQEKLAREVAKTQAYMDKKKSSNQDKSTSTQKQIEDLVGITNKTKSAEASARVFEKAWLNASNKVSSKTSKTSKDIGEVAQKTSSGATLARSALSKVSQLFGQMCSSMSKGIEPIINRLGVFAHFISPNLVKKLQSFKSKSTQAFSKLPSLLSAVSSAFRRVSGNADKAENSNTRLIKKFKSLNGVSKRLSNFFNTASNSLKNFNNNLKNTGVASSFAQKAIRALSMERIAEFLSEGIKQSISYVENMNLFNVAMGKAIDKGNKFVDTMQELYGMDPSNIMRYAGNFFQLATAIEMPDEAATQLSLTMTKAVNDISSLFNVDIETVFENMSSGLQGMSRAVRKYGMDIRTTTLQTEALALGITDQVESMSEANRIGLRFIAMMKQASNATGDFAANIETPANQMRIFKEQITQLGRAIGDFFIAPLRNALQYINGFIMAVRSVLVFIRKTLQIETDFQTRTEGLGSSLSSASSGISGIGDAASGATKKLKGMLAPFDELNVLTQNASSMDSSGSGIGSDIMDPRIAQAIQDMEYKFEDIEMKANKVRNALLEFFGFKVESGGILDWDPSQFENNLINKFPQWTKTIQATFDNWTSIVEGFKKVFNSLGDVFVKAWDKYKESIGKVVTDESVSNFINNLSDNLDKFSERIDENSERISSFIALLMKLVTIFIILKAVSPVITIIANAFSLLSKVFSLLFTVGTQVISLLAKLPQIISVITSPIGLVIAAIILLMATSEDFRKSVINLLSTLWDLLKPIIDIILQIVSMLMDTLLPIVLDVIGIIGDALAPIIDLISEILKSLQPLVNFIAGILTEVIKGVGETLRRTGESLANFFKGIRDIIQGIVKVIRGILTGDFKEIGRGLLSIFVGVLNAISGVVETVVNAITGAINLCIRFIWRLLSSFVNSILSGVNKVLDFIGTRTISWQMSVESPQIPRLNIPRAEVPAFATGGVVTGPTMGILGEAGRDEAVIPLDNSPQMRNFISEIVSAINNSKSVQDQPTVIKVFIGNEQLDEYIYKSQKRRDLRTNGG